MPGSQLPERLVLTVARASEDLPGRGCGEKGERPGWDTQLAAACEQHFRSAVHVKECPDGCCGGWATQIFLTPSLAMSSAVLVPSLGTGLLGSLTFHVRIWDLKLDGMGSGLGLAVTSQWACPTALEISKTLQSSGVSHLVSPTTFWAFPSSVSISLFPFLACSLSLPLSSLALSVSSFSGYKWNGIIYPSLDQRFSFVFYILSGNKFKLNKKLWK